MTPTIDLERLVRTSDLRRRQGRHSRPGRLRGWRFALTVAAATVAITAVTTAIVT